MIDHLDDVALSASLDGEATEEERAHLGGCPPCASRRDALARAAAAIGTPVPVIDGARRETTIATVLAARVVPLHRRRPPRWALGAVAAGLLAAVLVPLLRPDEPTQQTAIDSNSEEAQLRAAPAGLGEVARADLPARIRALAAPPVAGDDAEADAVAGSQATAARAAAPCEAELRARNPGLAEIRASTTLVLDGRPGHLLVFAAAADLRAFVVDEADCEVLAALSVTP
jgi:hypothetical protein